MKHLTAEPDLTLLEEPYKDLVRTAMTKDPDTRLQSVSEMLERLPHTNGAPRYVPPPQSPPPDVAKASNAHSTSTTTASDEEPILAAVRDGWRELEDRFHKSNVHPLIKAVALFGLLLILIESGLGRISVLVSLGFAYLVYRAVRAIILPPRNPVSESYPRSNHVGAATVHHRSNNQDDDSRRVPTPEELSTPPVKQTKRHYARRRRQNLQVRLNEYVAARPVRDRATELLGSMLVSAVIASLLALIGVAFVGDSFSGALYLWMAITATVGSWAVMIPTKLGEGRVEDQAPLRFGLLVAGALVGIVACGVAQSMTLELPVSQNVAIGPWDSMAGEMLQVSSYESTIGKAFREGAVPITLSMATAYFSFLFVVLRWWRQAELTRPDRVSIWSIIACMSAAFLMTFVWWFPQPAGAVLAGIIAFTTQLSSPWMPPSKRRELAEQGVV